MNKYAVVIAFILSVVSYAHADMSDAYNKTTDVKKIAWMDKGKKTIKLKLKDPGSAKFRNVYFHRGADNIPMTCGEVNSKNSFGGYIGFQKFVSAGSAELTFLQEEVADFHNIWNRMCI